MGWYCAGGGGAGAAGGGKREDPLGEREREGSLGGSGVVRRGSGVCPGKKSIQSDRDNVFV